MSKYTLQQDAGGYTLLRYGKPCTPERRPNNAELQFWMEREAYRKALAAVQRVMWMAEKYAEGGGSRGIEQDNYDEAMKAVAVELSSCSLSSEGW